VNDNDDARTLTRKSGNPRIGLRYPSGEDAATAAEEKEEEYLREGASRGKLAREEK